jgi:hypothetical protein
MTMDWTKEQYNKQYEKWVPWLEDMYLHYFTKDNKASYTAKGMFFFNTPLIQLNLMTLVAFTDPSLPVNQRT